METTSKNKDETSANDAIEKPLLYGPYVTRNSFTCSPISALLRCCKPINFFTSHSFSLFSGNEEISLDLRGKFGQKEKDKRERARRKRELFVTMPAWPRVDNMKTLYSCVNFDGCCLMKI